ncbi:hypothetical protein BIW11_11028 [Tropilaelaps mercedesae]|uniref:Uncharacterized protein n=1 Tax=Tropilaelaps mercedesae TaxID=418985 RepID=A0A1V9XCW4_9ACAR|nr:hypothetical protein BIW11_11028 [Tropilaelaps mercedesae]
MATKVILLDETPFASHWGTPTVNADIEAANAFIDSVVDEMRYDTEMKANLDPLRLHRFGEGNYEITDGRVFGLLGFTRKGNSSLLYSSDGETVVVSTPIAVDDVFFYGRHSYSKAFVTIRGDIEAKIARIDANSIVRMPYNGGTTSKLESLMIQHMHGLEITRITGVSRAFNWLLRIVANRVTKHFRENIETAFERDITQKFEAFLRDRTSAQFNGSAGLTETPFEGELQTLFPGSEYGSMYFGGFMG